MIMPPTSVMDLLTRLETLLRGVEQNAASGSPKTEEALGLVRMIRRALPAELSEVHRLRAEAERIHRHAQDEARRIVLEAQATVRRRTDGAPQPITTGQDHLADVQRKAKEIREGADTYAMQVLGELEGSILRVLEAIRKGKQLLKDASR
jgi:hypothetical protein